MMPKSYLRSKNRRMAKIHETVLEIHLKNLKHNFDYLRSCMSTSIKFMAVVKAYAYGSDSVAIAKNLELYGVDYFAVAYVQEGIILRESGITKPILVLHPQISNLEKLSKFNLEPSLYNVKVLNAFLEVSITQGMEKYPVHIKFNTGLNRLGFWGSDMGFLKNCLKNNSTIKIVSIFSHLAASEDINERGFSQRQIGNFKKISEDFYETFGFMPMLHMCNTSGMFNYPDAHFDMVRCGIGLYGFGNSKERNTHLKPIAKLKSVISQIHLIEEGETVGYNRAYKSTGSSKTATIPIGHADGIGRQYGNGIGFVVINGEKAPIVGNVCMDMLMVNISDIDCKEGDEVLVFGEEHTAENLAEQVNSISYEMITAVSQRIKRVIID